MGRKTIFQESVEEHANRLGRSYRSTVMLRRVLERRRLGQENTQIVKGMGESNCPYYLLEMSIEELERGLGVTWNGQRYVPGEYAGHTAASEIPGDFSPLLAGDSSKEALARAGYTPSQPPFGYTKRNKATQVEIEGKVYAVRLVGPVQEEADLVQQAFHLYSLGFTMAAVADQLNDPAEAWPRTRTGKDWDKDNLRELLGNPYYAGYVLYRGIEHRNSANRRGTGTLYPGHHPALVRWEAFVTVQQMRYDTRVSRGHETPEERLGQEPGWICPWEIHSGDRGADG